MTTCKDCPDRVTGCHAFCEKYKAYIAELEKIKENRRQHWRQSYDLRMVRKPKKKGR